MADIFYPGMPNWLDALNQLAKGQLQPIQIDWNAAPGSVKEILNKPDLALKAGIRSAGMRNRIINGDMRIAQRGTSGSITGGYTLDRWILTSTGTAPAWSQQRTSSSAMMDYAFDALSWAGVAGNTGVIPLQCIESVNCADLAGSRVSVSFWVYQSTGQAQTMTPSLVYSGGAADSWGSQIPIPTLDPAVIVPSGVWTMVTNRFNVPAAASTGLGVYPWKAAFAFGAGSAGYLSKVQLEPGDTVTPFDVMPKGLQLLNCQRYYERIGGVTAEGYVVSGTTALAAIAHFKASKRVVPTMGAGAASFIGCSYSGISGATVDLAMVRSTGTTTGNAAFTVNIVADAEIYV